MADNRLGHWPRSRVLVLAAVAGIFAGSVAVYVRGLDDGNGVAAGAGCGAAVETASRVEPYARGEVAAFQVAGQPEPLGELAFLSPDGAPTTLAALAGRTVLLNLWATWCVPCREEMPALDRLQTAMGGDEFTVAAVNIDLNDPERARAFLDQIGVTALAFYSDPTARLFTDLKRRGLAFGLPATILVDGQGCRIGAVQGPAVWDSDDAKALVKAALGPA
jgi:thiol-disulfide isomerase/thioredoxin